MKHLLVFLFIAMLFITAAGQACSPALGAENLIVNGDLELGSGGVPECWTKVGEKLGHILDWVADPAGQRGMVLKSEYTGEGDPSYFNWQQTVYNIKPNAWYEFSVDFAMYEIEPNIDETGHINQNSWWAGVSLIIESTHEIADYWGRTRFWAMGPKLVDWDDGAWIYRTYEVGNQGWRTYKKRFKTPSNADVAGVMTYNLPKGKLYVDNVILKEVDSGDETAFKKSGALNFIKYKGQDFFPIVFLGIPLENSGNNLSLAEIKEKGFNTAGETKYKINNAGIGAEKLKQIYSENDLALMVGLSSIVSKENDPLNRPYWVNDPLHSVNYIGAEATRKTIGDFNNFENLLFFRGEDEITCHPTRRTGNFLPDLKSFQTIKSYTNSNAPGKLLLYNFCGVPYPYTGLAQDSVDYYFPITDVITYTQNMPVAYDGEYNEVPKARALGIGGKLTSWVIASSPSKYVLAYVLGEREWALWDGINDSNNPYIGKLPFNLQRFQAWDQIINGAVGVLFHGYTNSPINLENTYDNYHYQQLTTISKELSELYPVLLTKEFFGEWEVSDPRIEIMMKKHNGKIYLLTASTHYEDLRNVTITLNSKYKITKITALNDIANGNIDNPTDRSIAQSTANSFVDDFVGDNAGSPAAVATPGYAVHVYEIEFSECGNGQCDSGETFETCPADCTQECIDTPKLMNQYIPQWKKGERTMLSLMQKMRQWKAGTGCPTPA